MITIQIDDFEKPETLKCYANFLNELADSRKLMKTEEEIKISESLDLTHVVGGMHELPEHSHVSDAEEIKISDYVKVSPGPVTVRRVGVELDDDGVRWDARIHNKNKTKTRGKWKLIRGLDASYIDNIKFELRNSPHSVLKFETDRVTQDKNDETPNEGTYDFIPPPPPEGVPHLSQDGTTAPIVDDYISLMKKITPAVTAGKLTYIQVFEAVRSVGVQDLALLPASPEKIPEVCRLIDEAINGK